jgi:hypothetical protein
MTKSQILNFLKIFSLQAKIVIKFVPRSKTGEFYPCQVSEIDDKLYLVELSRKDFIHNKDQLYLKALLLHELGHIAASCLKIKNPSIEEYTAHKWALNITKKRKYLKLHYELCAMLESWREYTWNEDKGSFRKYIIASYMKTSIKHLFS